MTNSDRPKTTRTTETFRWVIGATTLLVAVFLLAGGGDWVRRLAGLQSAAAPGPSPSTSAAQESSSPAATPTPTPTPSSGYTNSVGMEFLPVPAGTFLMGAPDTDPDATPAEQPQHEVTISEPFLLGRLEVTQAQWEAVMGSNPYTLDRSNPFYNLPGMAERITRPDHPATVSWNDAQTFIAQLNASEGVERYRLPTEAEWEYAARAGTTTPYSFGDDATELSSYAWVGEDFTTGGTHPVGQKLPNPWGLHDIHGNAWEWVQDAFDAGYYAASPSVDPTGPATEATRVVRGGSWHITSDSWRTAFRKEYEPDYRGISIGFRVLAMTEEGAAAN